MRHGHIGISHESRHIRHIDLWWSMNGIHLLYNSPPKFNSSPLKNGDWKTIFLLGFWSLPPGRAVKNFGRASGWQKYMAGTVEWSLLRYYLLTKKCSSVGRHVIHHSQFFWHPSKTFRQPLSYGSTIPQCYHVAQADVPSFWMHHPLAKSIAMEKSIISPHLCFQQPFKKNTQKKTTRLKTNPFAFPPTKNKYTPED